MQHPDYNSPSQLKLFLESQGMAMQKKFGQNFMINPDARRKIVDAMAISSGDKVWEIGPGLGCMSEEIMKRGAELTVFEIDRGFVSLLQSFFEEENKKGSFRIVQGDVLKTWKKECPQKDSSIDLSTISSMKLSGNLPYNIAATFIADTIAAGLIFERCVFTVQKEVAFRMAAKPSSENYSAFSVLCQYSYDVHPFLELGPGNFWPKPNVSSESVVMTAKKDRKECSNPKLFLQLVHTLFSSRRKTIANNIKGLLPKNISPDSFFEGLPVSKNLRAENLTIDDFILLAEKLNSAIISSRS